MGIPPDPNIKLQKDSCGHCAGSGFRTGRRGMYPRREDDYCVVCYGYGKVVAQELPKWAQTN